MENTQYNSCSLKVAVNKSMALISTNQFLNISQQYNKPTIIMAAEAELVNANKLKFNTQCVD